MVAVLHLKPTVSPVPGALLTIDFQGKQQPQQNNNKTKIRRGKKLINFPNCLFVYLLNLIYIAVRYLGSLEAFVSCSTRPQSSMVIGWREKESRSLRVTSFFTKRGVWDMDHHHGLNLIGGYQSDL